MPAPFSMASSRCLCGRRIGTSAWTPGRRVSLCPFDQAVLREGRDLIFLIVLLYVMEMKLGSPAFNTPHIRGVSSKFEEHKKNNFFVGECKYILTLFNRVLI
jgi:hypothetical protein